MKKGKIIKSVRKLGNFLEIDGKLYQPIYRKDRKTDEFLRFKLVKQQKESLKQIEKIAKKLAPKLNAQEVIRNALLDMPIGNINRIHKALFEQKKKPVIKQHHGCYDMEIGKEVIPIR